MPPFDKLRSMFEVLPNAAVAVDRNGRIVMANPAIKQILGYHHHDIEGQPLDSLLPPAQRERHRQDVAVFQSQAVGSRPMGERPMLHALHQSGHEVPVSISITNLDLDGERYSVAILRDAGLFSRDGLGAEHDREQRDPVTGLANRLFFSRALHTLLASRRDFALMLASLDNLGDIAQRCGAGGEEQVLRETGLRTLRHLRGGDVGARLDRNTLALLLPDMTHNYLVSANARALSHSLGRSLVCDGHVESPQVSIGCVIHPHHGDDEESLLKRARQASSQGREKQQLFCIDSG